MKSINVLALVAACSCPLYFWAAMNESRAAEAAAGAPPVGVELEDWIPLGEKLGFVIVPTLDGNATGFLAQGSADPSSRSLIKDVVVPPRPASGYFVAKSEGGWRRLVVLTPKQLADAN